MAMKDFVIEPIWNNSSACICAARDRWAVRGNWLNAAAIGQHERHPRAVHVAHAARRSDQAGKRL
jgi:hypothetical protein